MGPLGTAGQGQSPSLPRSPNCDVPARIKKHAPSQRNAMPLEQVPFGTNDFAVNPEPRLPCVLLLDVSTSMTGAPIHELNDGVFLYKGELMADPLAAKRVEVAI